MARLRVMHLLASFGIGGAETVALRVASGMDTSLFDVSACSLTGPGPMESRFRAQGVRTHALVPHGPPGARRLALVLALVRLLRRERVDILHSHNSMPLVCGTPAALIAGVRSVVCTRHAISLSGELDRSWLLERAVVRLVDHQIAVSRRVLERGLRTRRIVPGRASVIFNGVDTSLFCGRERGGGSAGGTVTLGCVARLSHEKCHCHLISAVNELLHRGCDVELKIVGSGDLRDDLFEQAARLGLGSHVDFMGTRSDVPELLRGFDIFVLPSRFEGLPLTVIEAMASGLPVVATQVGGLAELVQDGVNGLLVPPEDPSALADAIETLVRAPELCARMGRAGREIAVSRFDLSVAVRRHEELYLRLLGAPRATRTGEA